MDIKTRESYNPIQPTNTARQASALMKKAYIKSRQTAEEQLNTDYESAEQYANDEAERNVEQTAAATAIAAKKAAESVYHTVHNRHHSRQDTALIDDSAETPVQESPNIRQRRTGEIKTRQTADSRENAIKTRTQARVEPVKRADMTVSTTQNVKHSSTAAIKTVTDAQKKSADTAKAVNDTTFKAQYAKQKAKKAKKAAEEAARALKAAVKGAITAVKSMVSALIAGGWVVLLIILIICMLGMIVGSAYGIFAGNDVSKATDGDTSRDLRTAVSTINSEYYNKIQNIRNGVENLENTTIYINGEVGAMAGVWQDVLAVYAVDTAHGENATIAIDFDSSKTQKLRDTFWDMVSISYNVIERPVEEEKEVTDEDGNITTETVEVIYRDLKIYVKTKNASQAAAMYAFSDEQNKVLTEMMSEQFTKSWSDLIYGYSYGDEDIVAVAISQIGNIGGEPYWRWYGLSSRTEWCAIFVSWCADQCGYLDSGVIPKFAWVPDAVSWFQARGQWQPRGYTPAPGDIIFFDWEGDGGANHVGIVEYVENGVVHTVEGNSGDACKRKQYAINSSSVLGYGIPMYE